jgi:hypothetical protein
VELPGGYGDGVMASFIYIWLFVGDNIGYRTSDDIRVTLEGSFVSC